MINHEEVIKKIRFFTDRHANAAMFKIGAKPKILAMDRTVEGMIKNGYNLVAVYSKEVTDEYIIEDLEYSF